MRAELLRSFVALATLFLISGSDHSRLNSSSSGAVCAMIGAPVSVIWARVVVLQDKILSVAPAAFTAKYASHSEGVGCWHIGLYVQRPPPF